MVNMNLIIILLHGLVCSRSTMYPVIPYTQLLKGREDQAVHSTDRKGKRSSQQEAVALTSRQSPNL